MAALTRWSRGDKVTRRVPPLRDCSRAARTRGCLHVVRAESTAVARLARAQHLPCQQQQQQAHRSRPVSTSGRECASALCAALWSYVFRGHSGPAGGLVGCQNLLEIDRLGPIFFFACGALQGGALRAGAIWLPPRPAGRTRPDQVMGIT